MKKKLIISLLLVGILAFSIGAGTFAYFTSTATSANNAFSTGTLDVNVPSDAIFTISNWAPGDSDTKTLTLTNDGSLDAKVRLYANYTAPSGGEPASDHLTLLVTDANGNTIYNGYLKDFNQAAAYIWPNMTAGTSMTLTFTIGLPTTASNDWQGQSASASFVVDATQTNANF